MVETDLSNHQSLARVLIVEDEAMARRALASLLNSSGYEASSAKSAEEALRILAADPQPDVALVDFNLPGMTGMDLIELLRKSHPEMFLVMLSAQPNPLPDNHHWDAVPFLRKPFNFKQLLSLIRSQSPHGESDFHA